MTKKRTTNREVKFLFEVVVNEGKDHEMRYGAESAASAESMAYYFAVIEKNLVVIVWTPDDGLRRRFLIANAFDCRQFAARCKQLNYGQAQP